ncbi:MAG: adenylate/guanylate cyclase domain-containing response regulator [Spirochaetia bacterium]|nr:adenylate/guanylate cyclase domain-containing response regulator [Spirochaetia bacterium]
MTQTEMLNTSNIDDRTRPGDFEILVVEDNPVAAGLVKELLELLRYRVRVATTGANALEEIRSRQAHLLLIDWHLPDMTGVELFKTARELDPDCTAIMMSVDKSTEILLQSLDAGAEDFLEKPLALGELSARLQNILESVKYRSQERALTHELTLKKEMLSRYFSADILDTILRGEMKNQSGGKTIFATILVFDLRNSTGLAESMGALPFAEFLNPIIVDLMDLVTDQGGSVARLTGDGLIALFTRDAQQLSARSALDCGVRIEAYFKSVRESGIDQYTDQLAYGIGIASGVVFTGNIGTHQRLDFTIVGDTLDRAARLESLTKKLQIPVLSDNPTVRISGSEHPRYAALKARVKGRDLTIFGLKNTQPNVQH